MRLRTLIRAATLGLTVTTLSFAAAADVAGAQAFVEKEHGAIKKLVDANAAQSEVTKVIDAMVDYDEVARRALGQPCPTTIPSCTNHWAELNDDQKKEMTSLFRQLVEKKYRENAQKTKDYDISYRGAKEAGNDIAKVRTEAKDKNKPREPAVQVDYLIKGSGPYKVVDLVTEGSILSKNYYDQSHKMLTTQGQGYPYLVQKLKDRIAGKKDKDSK
ncbi:MAG: ABC transporter substrate-binding protein [Labilithrix sp.]|nr:ABC transporter substrate-binding protein [Labilithrix sp.]MCW5815641.1 ABC transporter substrate-binding protein [Labilithrix sp.]